MRVWMGDGQNGGEGNSLLLGEKLCVGLYRSGVEEETSSETFGDALEGKSANTSALEIIDRTASLHFSKAT